MTVKVIYPNSDVRRIRWLDKVCKAVDRDESADADLFTSHLREKTRVLAQDYQQVLDSLRQTYEQRRTAVARRREVVQKLRLMVLAARNALHHRARMGIIEATRLDLYKSPGEPLRTEYTKMDDWLLAARNLIKGDVEAEAKGMPVLLEPSRVDLTAHVTAYISALQAVQTANQRMATLQGRINALRDLVFDLHRELFAWLKARYYNLTSSERRDRLRVVGFEYVSVNREPQVDDPTSEVTDNTAVQESQVIAQDQAEPRNEDEPPQAAPEAVAAALPVRVPRTKDSPPHAGAMPGHVEEPVSTGFG